MKIDWQKLLREHPERYAWVQPGEVYKTTGWVGWDAFLGTGRRPPNAEALPFEEARAYARSLGLKNQEAWVMWCKSGKRPSNIPSNPNKVYEGQFKGYYDWLDYAPSKCTGHRLPFEEARTYARSLGLKSMKAWVKWCRSGKRPFNIPAQPSASYKGQFKNDGDWLGYVGACLKPLPFEEARAYARKLKLKGQREWYQWCNSGKRPDNIPSDPRRSYKGQFKGYSDWLGYLGRCMEPLPFEEARAYARSLKLESARTWREWCKSSKRPSNVPCHPDDAYENQFISWADWLGHGRFGHGRPRKRRSA
jgi:hypothetical protein